MRTTVRPMREEDAAVLPAVERSAGAVFRAVPDLAWIADDDVLSAADHRRFVQEGMAWVAVDARDRPFGFLSAERAGDELHVWQIAVHERQQGQGHGRALIGTAITWAEAHDLAAITLTTFRDLPWNEPFYRRLGFRTLQPDALGDRLAQVLQKEAAHGLPPDRRCAMRLALSGVS